MPDLVRVLEELEGSNELYGFGSATKPFARNGKVMDALDCYDELDVVDMICCLSQ